jgi:hypothetical protein
MATGTLPERKGWLYEANVIDQAGPLPTDKRDIQIEFEEILLPFLF